MLVLQLTRGMHTSARAPNHTRTRHSHSLSHTSLSFSLTPLSFSTPPPTHTHTFSLSFRNTHTKHTRTPSDKLQATQVYIKKIIKSSGLGKLAYKPDW